LLPAAAASLFACIAASSAPRARLFFEVRRSAPTAVASSVAFSIACRAFSSFRSAATVFSAHGRRSAMER
jgi:hypothetical protein